MIYEETYRYLLTNVSSTEFDVCLYSLLNTDWDGHVRVSMNEIAERIGTTKKYMKEMMRKFTSKAKGRFVFVPERAIDGDVYRFNLGKTGNLDFNENTDRYCKKYNFFYTEEFRQLPINAKRLVLMGAFRMSTSKSELISIPVDTIVPNTKNKSILPFTKQRLSAAIEEINSSKLNQVVNVSLASNVFTREELVILTFKPGTLHNFKNNHTERFMLRKKLFEAGYQSFLPDAFCIEIEKVGKFIYNSLLRIEKENAKKQGVISNAKNEMLQLARFIYNAAIVKLAHALNSKKEELSEPKQVSAYFSSIVYELALEEMTKYSHQAESVRSLLEMEHLHKDICSQEQEREVDYLEVRNFISPIREKYKFLSHIALVLENWCEEWVVARVNTLNEDIQAIAQDPDNEAVKEKRGWSAPLDGEEQRNNLKHSILEKLSTLSHWLSNNGNAAVEKKERGKLLTQMQESLVSYFAINSDNQKNKRLAF
ncbi:hypothetical protein [Bacillus sp. FJAT-29937]|uniref:hypothetical protein n=1 Tax=Bacillus sp. FJAT-29937 TaxID=1720553 RepID=UPI00082BD221|nr:hypothetical protein [Bacillus sp. FJAT-29937]